MRWPALFSRAQPRELVEEKTYTGFTDLFKSDPGWFQKALDATNTMDVSQNTAVYSCVNIISQEIASLRCNHWRINKQTGARERVTNSRAAAILRRPNNYQTASDFMLYMIRSLLFTGNAIAAAERNAKTEVSALHVIPPRSAQPMVAPDTGDVYYDLSGFQDGLFRPQSTTPSSNVLHVRINCNKHPLFGETPISAIAYSGATGSAIQRSVARFFTNMARPSGVLTTPKVLTSKQMEELRTQWLSKAGAEAVGGTPVLHSDLKWEPITMSATDAEVIASYNLSVADVAMAYRVPLFMLGDLTKASFRNVETLMRMFYTSSLRFYLEHLENALDRLFELDGETEYLEYDIESGLLRGDLEQRMTALVKGIQGGVLTPNEARLREELPPIEGGNEAFLQKQMVPVSMLSKLAENELRAAMVLPEDPANSDGQDPADPEEDPEDEAAAVEAAKAFLQRIVQ